MSENQYYGKDYYEWQKSIGAACVQSGFGFFAGHINLQDVVLDFGCGGGFLLQALSMTGKYGVEINPHARKEASFRGVEVFEDIESLPADINFDKVISHHSLEHVRDPYNTLIKLKSKLKINGRLLLVLPIDDWRNEKKYVATDINRHLYTWTPQLIGNLLDECGFQVEDIELRFYALVRGTKWLKRFLPRGCI